ncbi:MAG: Flp pilus assembly complex ATPase component TadA [Betaproteobacteria bacterium]|nr:Flp pilus assembly complex ATPase component TadA [Betaproteobacteria bacterium]
MSDDLEDLLKGPNGEEPDDEDRTPQVVALVDSMLRRAIEQGAGDVFLSPSAAGMAVAFRIGGELGAQPGIESRDVAAVAARLKILGNLDISERKLPQNGWFDVDEPIPSRIWISTLPVTGGEDIRLEIARKADAPTLEQLHVSDAVIASLRRTVSARRGLFLVVGPSRDVWTALQGAVGTLAPHGRSLIISGSGALGGGRWPEVALNPSRGFTMAWALRSAFRQDFDLVLVSEILDFETANAALRGGLDRVLIAGMFCPHSWSAVTRLLDMGLDPLLIRDGLAGAISVRAARKLCPDCRAARPPADDVIEAFRAHESAAPQQIFRSAGCPSCHGLGHRGEVLLGESFLVSQELRRLLLQRPDEPQIRNATVGSVDPLALDGLEKVRRGIISFEEFIRAAV